jgi:hypothetical protein
VLLLLPQLGGAVPERDSGRKAGFNRLKNEGFQALLSASILTCEEGEKEDKKGTVNRIRRSQLSL